MCGAPVMVDQDVRRLEVAVDEPGEVGVVRGLGDPRQEARDPGERRPLGLDDLREVAPLDVLEHDEGLALAVMADVIDPDDPRMDQARRDARLGQERLDLSGAAEHARVQGLDRHQPTELLVAGEIHPAEPAMAQQGDDRVASEPLGERLGRRDRRWGVAQGLHRDVHGAAGRAVAGGRTTVGTGRAGGRLLGAPRFERLPREDLGDRLGPVGAPPEVFAGCRRLAARACAARSRSPAARGAAAGAAMGRCPQGTPRSADRRRPATSPRTARTRRRGQRAPRPRTTRCLPPVGRPSREPPALLGPAPRSADGPEAEPRPPRHRTPHDI